MGIYKANLAADKKIYLSFRNVTSGHLCLGRSDFQARYKRNAPTKQNRFEITVEQDDVVPYVKDSATCTLLADQIKKLIGPLAKAERKLEVTLKNVFQGKSKRQKIGISVNGSLLKNLSAIVDDHSLRLEVTLFRMCAFSTNEKDEEDEDAKTCSDLDESSTERDDGSDLYYEDVCSLATKEMKLENGRFEDNANTFPGEWWYQWKKDCRLISFAAEVDVKISIPYVDVSWSLRSIVGKSSEDNPLFICKKLLHEGTGADTIIIADGDVQVRCHKGFLIAHSPVLKALFEGGFAESTSNSVKMDDVLDEAGVNALLSYLYLWDLTIPQENSGIAVQLLRAAHKYEITTLETAMEEILKHQPNIWFETEALLELFIFTCHIDNMASLKSKALEVLKSKKHIVKESEEYKEFIKGNPVAGAVLNMIL